MALSHKRIIRSDQIFSRQFMTALNQSRSHMFGHSLKKDGEVNMSCTGLGQYTAHEITAPAERLFRSLKTAGYSNLATISLDLFHKSFFTQLQVINSSN